MKNMGTIILSMFMAVSILSCNRTDASAVETVIADSSGVPTYKPAPEAFKSEIAQKGSMEEVTYSSKDPKGNAINKVAYVYLPYQYDKDKQYDILYLMHGAMGNSGTMMGTTTSQTNLKRVIDNMINQKLIKPVIVVTPTVNVPGYDLNDDPPLMFQQEVGKYLIPAIESRYSTYAASVAEEDLIASRDHRSFGGFSMGSTTTWLVLINNLAYFRNFIPISGDCWAVERMGGVGKPEETATLIAESIKSQGYSANDFFIFSATGTDDIAYRGLTNQINEMKKLTDVFRFDYDSEKGNLYYMEAPNGQHDYNWVTDYLYDLLPYVFKN